MHIDIIDNIQFVCECKEKFKSVYWLNLNNGKAYNYDDLKKIYDFSEFEETKMFQKGYVAFPCILFIDIQRKFIEDLNDKQLAKKLFRLPDVIFSSKFWMHVDDGGYMLSMWYDFLNLQKATLLIDWCNLNNIKYRYK